MIPSRAGDIIRSVNVALIAAGLGHPSDVCFRSLGRQTALLGDDLKERAVDVAGHSPGVAADVEVGPLLEPTPELAGALAHPVLDVDLLGLVAREGGVEACKVAVLLELAQFGGVEEIGGLALIAEEKPVLARG